MAASRTQTLDEALLRGEPYFGENLAAYQGGINRKACLIALLNRVIDECDGRPVRVLEVGSWAGGSATTWALGIKQRGVAGSVLCVDHWQPYFDLSTNTAAHYAEMKHAAETGDIYRLFLHNLRAMGVDDIVDHIKGRAEDVLPTLESNTYDIVFLDGSHSYEAVRTDISNAKRLVREGGILCGDDLELEENEVDLPAQQLAIEKDVDFTADPRTGISYHPGVTKAVAEAFDEVSEQQGVWCVAKRQDVWKPVEFQPAMDDVPRPLIDLKPPEDEVTPQLVSDFKNFNIVRRGKTYLGLRRSLASIDLTRSDDAIRTTYDVADVVFGEDQGSVMAQIAAIESDAIAEGLKARLAALEHSQAQRDNAQLVATIGETNIVRCRDNVFAIPQSLGDVDVRHGAEWVRSQFPGGEIEISNSAAGLIATLLDRRLMELRGAVVSSLEAAHQRLSGLEQIIAIRRAANEEVRLVAVMDQTNIVQYKDDVFAIPQHLGEVNVTEGTEAIRKRFPDGEIEMSDSAVSLIAARIEKHIKEIRNAIEALHIASSERFGEIKQAVEVTSDDLNRRLSAIEDKRTIWRSLAHKWRRVKSGPDACD